MTDFAPKNLFSRINCTINTMRARDAFRAAHYIRADSVTEIIKLPFSFSPEMCGGLSQIRTVCSLPSLSLSICMFARPWDDELQSCDREENP